MKVIVKAKSAPAGFGTAAPERRSAAATRTVTVLIALLLLPLAACSQTVDPESLGADGQRILAVSRASDTVFGALVEAAQDGEPNGDAWGRSRSLLEVFASDMADLPPEDADVAQAGTLFVDAGNIMLGFLQNNDTTRAQSFLRDRVTTNHERLSSAIDARLESMGGSPISGGNSSSMPAGLTVGVLLVVGVAIWMFRQSQTTAAHEPEPRPAAATDPVYAPTPTSESAGAEQTPSTSTPSPPPPPEDPVRSRLQPTDLNDVLDASVSRLRENGWEITLDSPDVKVMADPLRLRRLVGTLLLSSTMHDPTHIGVVAATEKNRVVISVGDDGSLDSDGNTLPPNAGPDNPPTEVANQLSVARRLAGAMEADVTWVRHGGISLYTVDLAKAE